jgi:DNA-binding MarR family transcriptional regulator
VLVGLGREVTARVRRTMRPLDFGVQEFRVLEQLQALGEASQAELAAAVGIDRSNLAVIVADLADRELVDRARDDVDRRRYVLRLSRAAQRLLRRTEGAIRAAEEDLLAPLDQEQREELHRLLRQLADAIDLCPSGDGTC